MPSSIETVQMRIRLTPKGGRDALVKREAGVLHARVASPPIDGAANRALVALLSKALGIPRSRITIISGENSREKVVRLDGVDTAELERRIEQATNPL